MRYRLSTLHIYISKSIVKQHIVETFTY